MTGIFNSENRNGFYTCKILYVDIFYIFNSIIIFDRYIFLERFFSKKWPPGLYKNPQTFAMTDPMVTPRATRIQGKGIG